MKCRTVQKLRADVNCYPAYVSIDEMGREVIAIGTVICKDEFPPADCVSLVQNGLAVPLDDECRKACNRTEAQIEAARAAMEAMLHPPEDDEEESEEDE